MTGTRCPGSGQPGFRGSFPGDSDRCRTCGASVRVKQDGTVGSHRRQTGRNAEIARLRLAADQP